MPNLAILIRKHWFLVGILSCILLAEIFPTVGATGGPLKPEWTVNYVAVASIFFFSGISLSTNDIILAIRKFKVHLFIQIFTFVLIPVFVLVMSILLQSTFSVNEWILKGFATVSCMPPPISSAVILTKAVGGNEAVAVMNSVLGNFIGIVVTPLTLFLFLGTTAIMSVTNTVIMLIQTVLLPLVAGQLARHAGILSCVTKLPRVCPNLRVNIFTLGQLILLFIMYTSFCDAFRMYDIPMNASDVLVSVLLVLIIHILILYGSFLLANRMRFTHSFSPDDIIAIIFCSTHKSLTLGISILRILFSGYAHFSQITLPLLMYHPTQIILGGLVLPYLKIWLNNSKNESSFLP